MYRIFKTTTNSPTDFAAEELRKYLRMMMPEAGNIPISYDPAAKTGFRLGLMQDFGLDISDAENPELDDILYIDTDAEGGIIAGDNPRSVLLAVYEYLRQNGCRWLYPGVDGEYIPMQDIVPVRYRHLASCRCRSFCYEGAVIQQSLLDMIDLSPKLGMNTYMLEHRETIWHYGHFYRHLENTENRKPEAISDRTAIQWKRACEAEIQKRGLIYHNVGHGWTSDPFKDDPEYPNYMAQLNGKRALHGNAPVYTNVCLSNTVVRKKICDYLVNYAARHDNTDYMHIWLADMSNNHCECEACLRKTPSDWYVILLNEMDEALRANGLDTRLVFISYVDTTWAPKTERLNNPDRFSLLFAPIQRSYVETLSPLDPDFKLEEFRHNKNKLPKNLSESLEYLKEWQKIYDGLIVSFEYHFWHHFYREPSGIFLARRIHEDVRAYSASGLDGVIEDGSVRPFFPNGLALYTFARTLFDTSLSFEEIVEDYFPYVYGEDWKKFYDYLNELGQLFDHAYLEGARTKDIEVSSYYNPEHVRNLEKIPALLKRGEELVRTHYNSDYRVQTLAVRLLEHHIRYCELFADALVEKAQGHEQEAWDKYQFLRLEFGKHELEIERYYDHFMAAHTFKSLFKIGSNLKKPIIV